MICVCVVGGGGRKKGLSFSLVDNGVSCFFCFFFVVVVVVVIFFAGEGGEN